MKLTAFSSLISLIVVIASTVVSVAVTASEQPLLRASNLKDAEVAFRSIHVDVPVSAPGPDDTPQSRELQSKGKVTSDVRGTTAFYDDCTDDESFRYGYINKKGKSKLKGGCTNFVARKTKKRCRKRMIDGRKVHDFCPLTCSSCKNKMTNGKIKMCGIENFIGAWQYASPCGGGGVFELTVRCDDGKLKKHNTKCYVRDKKIMDATDDGGLVDTKEDETCVREGVVSTDVLYNSITGNCLLPFVALNEGTCDEIFREGVGVKAEIAVAASVSDKKDALMKIKFTRDEGESYYNDETPYEGYFVLSGGGRSLLSTSLNNIRNLSGFAYC